MNTLTLEEFQAQCKAQAESSAEIVFKCPMCETLQCGNDFIKVQAGKDFEEVSKYIGFSCIGRFTEKGSPSSEKGKFHGCNWTLGGLFSTHKLEVLCPDGEKHPHFEIASLEDAQTHRAKTN